ncbi:MAG TPA: hypothetical protein VL977_03445 [Solirubrobacteraceae bacterium]|nr:hypothetical protein [Solirubrobacteraceae bacterium]
MNVTRLATRVRGRARAPLALAALAALTLAGAGAAHAGSSGPACGAATGSTVYAVDNRIVHEIYQEELASAEVTGDIGHITASTRLAAAVASGDHKRIYAAVHAIVYTPHWHIVRLRVLSPSGAVLADVGGPYILAPLTGQITYDGNVVATFVTSVQDDRGYAKLIAAIAGVPVELYLNGRPLMGSVAKPPASAPPSGPLTLHGVRYTVDAYDVEAFPTGTLHVVVLVPQPPKSLGGHSCAAVHLQTVAAIVQRVFVGLTNAGFPFAKNKRTFITQAAGYSQGPVFVYKHGTEVTGTNDLPGSTAPSPPAALTKRPQITYAGQSWLVASFERYPPYTVYVLQPATLTGGATGASGTT